MGFRRTFANADKSLVLTMDANDNGIFNGQFTYRGTAYPISGSWHNGVSEASTYYFLASSPSPNQLMLAASGIIFGARHDKQPYELTIAGAAAMITGSGMDAPHELTSFAHTLSPQKK